MTKLIILDRDGVINWEPGGHCARHPDEVRLLEGSAAAIGRLNNAGIKVAVATNQGAIKKGFFDEAMLAAIHRRLLELIAVDGGHIDALFYCPHYNEDQCRCRKPEPGMLHDVAEHFACSLDQVPFVGDDYRDVLAARAVDATPIIVRTGKGEETEQRLKKKSDQDVPVFANLAAVVDQLIGDLI
ncbi:MAG: D-glycero-beta-D-manno-heptose 1,7-bisphosphate 7-phosphatase [Gammaproteobacteria bacterium]|nr:D-glycero-beta-D-manno-heptose 1,7-bisphosphate 7-phosphatase [Gammaproteobacteria bacterium]